MGDAVAKDSVREFIFISTFPKVERVVVQGLVSTLGNDHLIQRKGFRQNNIFSPWARLEKIF